MSIITTSRVDATHPVLAQLVDAAGRGFTGALEISTTDSLSRALQVQVWMEEGLIRAVHGNGWVPPEAEYVQHRTGVDLSEEADPLKVAYTRERDGVPLLDADTIDAARRDWAYGLLAASLTWAKPRVRRVKKAVTAENKILPSPWQRVTADVAARVDGLESAWRVVCDALQRASIPPVPAGRACGILAVRIDGHALFTGAESLDQTAARAGLSRYVVLEDLSRAILSGAAVQFSQATPPQVQLLVPEHWEDPNRSWGWVDEVRPEPAAAEVDPDVDVDGDLEVDPDPEVVEEDVEAAADETLDELETLVAQASAAEPAQPALPAVAVAVPAVASPGATLLIEAWLRESVDDSDASVRGAIVRRLVMSAQQEAHERAVEYTHARAALEAAEVDAEASHLMIARATEAVTEAQAALAQAEAQVQRVEAEYADVMQAARDAGEASAAAQQAAEAEEAELTAMLERLAAQERAAVAARQTAETARVAAEAAEAEVRQSAGPVLAQARELADTVRVSTVEPAVRDLDVARKRAETAQRDAGLARVAVDEAATAAEHARVLASALGAGVAA